MNIKIYTQNVLHLIYYIHYPYKLFFNTFWHILKNKKIKIKSRLSGAHFKKQNDGI